MGCSLTPSRSFYSPRLNFSAGVGWSDRILKLFYSVCRKITGGKWTTTAPFLAFPPWKCMAMFPPYGDGTGYRLDGPEFETWQEKDISFFYKTSRAPFCPTQLFIQWGSSPAWSGLGEILTTHLHRAPRWRMGGASYNFGLNGVDSNNLTFTTSLCTPFEAPLRVKKYLYALHLSLRPPSIRDQ